MSIERRYALLQHTHDDRYYTETEIDSTLAGYLPLAGGTMTGTLGVSTTGSQVRIKESDAGDADDALLIDLNSNIGALQGFDNSAATYYNLVSINCTSADVTLGNTTGDTTVDGAVVSLDHGGTAKFVTQDETTDGEGTGAEVIDYAGNFHPVGVLYKPRFSLATSTNYNLGPTYLTRSLYGAASGTSLTTPASTDTTLSDGAAFEVFNLGSNSISVVAGSGVTLYGCNNGTLTTGTPRTIGGRSHAIIYRITASIWAVFGGNVT